MEDKFLGSLMIHLKEIEDPRSSQNTQHKLVNIFFISICAMLCGCSSYYEIADFGKSKFEWLNKFLSLEDKDKLPSHDTIRRVFTLIDFKVFQAKFINWTEEIRHTLETSWPTEEYESHTDQVCIDGKRLRGSFCNSKLVKSIHMVNAWSSKAGISLGSEPTNSKSNEITAIPELLNLLNLKGCLVSLDAMGCQKDIASKIVSKNGDYLLALKGNQSGLLEATEEIFRRSSTNSKAKLTKEKFIEREQCHARETERVCDVIVLTKKVGFLPEEQWEKLSSLVRIKSKVLKTNTGEIYEEERYYISSAKLEAEEFNRAVKKHWEVENKLHWHLDVSMKEDQDKKWASQSVKNFALLRQLALNLLRKDPTKKSIRRKQFLAGWDNSFLERLLFGC